MTAPAVEFKPFYPAAGHAAPEPGVDGFAALVALADPVSAGPPPVAPALVRRLVDAHMAVRSVRAVSGHLVTASLGVGSRPKWAVSWGALTRTQRDDLTAFLRGTVAAGGVGGGEAGFDLEPDGTGTGIVPVRVVGGYEAIADVLVGRGGAQGSGVYSIEDLTVEAMLP